MSFRLDAHAQILNRLDDLHIEYEVMRHPGVFTTDDVTARLSIPEADCVKTLAVRIGQGTQDELALCGISARGRLDYSGLSKLLGISRRRIRLLAADEIPEATGVPIGALGLVLPKQRASIVLSDKFHDRERIYFGAGRNDATVRISIKSLSESVGIVFGAIEKQ